MRYQSGNQKFDYAHKCQYYHAHGRCQIASPKFSLVNLFNLWKISAYWIWPIAFRHETNLLNTKSNLHLHLKAKFLADLVFPLYKAFEAHNNFFSKPICSSDPEVRKFIFVQSNSGLGLYNSKHIFQREWIFVLKVDEDLMRLLLPYILHGVGSNPEGQIISPDYRAATYMILVQLSTVASLASDLVEGTRFLIFATYSRKHRVKDYQFSKWWSQEMGIRSKITHIGFQERNISNDDEIPIPLLIT